jgi:hypothetical protein
MQGPLTTFARFSVMAIVASSSGIANAGPAVGQFEIKTLSAEPGEIELQSQNAYNFGAPSRRLRSTPDGLIGDDNSLPRQMHALEIEYGFSHHFKTRIGIEFEKDRVEDFDTYADAQRFERIALDEFEVEAIVVLKRRPGDGLGLGLLFEYEHPFESEGARTVTTGPILEWGAGKWVASFNPRVTKFFGGERDDDGHRDEKLDLGYSAAIRYDASDRLRLALEAYGVIERVGNSGRPSDEAALFGDADQHRIGPVGYWSFEPDGKGAEHRTGLGTLFGLNATTPATTLKLSYEITF